MKIEIECQGSDQVKEFWLNFGDQAAHGLIHL